MATRDDGPYEGIDDSVEDTMTDEGHRRPPVTRVIVPPPMSGDSGSHRPRSSSGGTSGISDVDRFRRTAILGRGGMGEVTSWRDDRLGREVAVKTLLPHAMNDQTARQRFLREARVQGQLEHPAIVPVYDLRDDGDDGLSLTMKRVRGKTLASLIDEHRTTGGPVSRKLLSAFSSVCLAVEFAHARGIVHRDLKPGNIMLGDFGEVYVLDWGLAKILGEPNDDDLIPAGDLSPAAMTQAGAVLGTLGYMAPEQLDERLGAVTAATDVYALGAILFELLTATPLLLAPTPIELMQRTLQGVDARARTRAPTMEVPPELEALCVTATQRLAHERTLSARGLHDGVEAYLEGDRDLSRRRALATKHIAEAEASLVRGRAGDVAETTSRSTAMRELGAALALEPGNVDAGRAILRLLAEPPNEIPAAVRTELDEIEQEQIREGARVGAPMAMSWLLVLPFALFMHVRDWRIIAVMVVLMVLTTAMSFVNSRLSRVPFAFQCAVFVLMFLLFMTSGFTLGPFVMVPTVIATFVASLQAHPSAKVRRFVLVAGCVLFTALVGLEWAGVLPRAYTFTDAGLLISPVLLDLPETPTRLLITLASLASTVAAALFIERIRDAQARAQAQVSLLSWHLRQLLGDERPVRD